MLSVLQFIFKCFGQFVSMLFEVDLGFMSLGMFLACTSFGVPTVIFVFNFLKGLRDQS